MVITLTLCVAAVKAFPGSQSALQYKSTREWKRMAFFRVARALIRDRTQLWKSAVCHLINARDAVYNIVLLCVCERRIAYKMQHTDGQVLRVLIGRIAQKA